MYLEQMRHLCLLQVDKGYNFFSLGTKDLQLDSYIGSNSVLKLMNWRNCDYCGTLAGAGW